MPSLRPSTLLLPLLLLLLPLTLQTTTAQPRLSFRDVTLQSGISERRPSLKYGGPLVCDFDSDGIYDLLLMYHNGDRPQLYFGSRNGSFTLADNFRTRVADEHGFTCAQLTARSPLRVITAAPGGGGGSNLRLPELYLVRPNRQIVDISEQRGLGRRPFRGRNIMFLDLSRKSVPRRVRIGGGPDVVFVSLLSRKTPGLLQYAYDNVNGNFSLRSLPGYETEVRGHIELTDIDNDGYMEILSTQTMTVYQLQQGDSNPSRFVDVTRRVMPRFPFRTNDRTIHAVTELDYDNDGDFDLYVARGDRSALSPLSFIGDDTSDLLLRNDNGVFVDVSARAGIPRGTNSVGVTADDFDNDGFVDLLVTLYEEGDMFLMNNGDGTFTRVDNVFPKASDTVGHNAVAVDYNMDGRVDVMLGQGGYAPPFRGAYFIYRSTLQLGANNRYLLVRVASDPRFASTSLHAVVRVFIGGRVLTRRVGSRGSQIGGVSYIDTVHFGLGSVVTVRRVTVTWVSGITRGRRNVPSNSRLFIGRRPRTT